MALRKIRLYGKLGQLFGREWNLDVNSVGEAIKAIDINTNNKFSRYLLKNGTKKYYKVCVKNKKNTISKEEIGTSFGGGDIYITPTISGSDKNATRQIILGVVMVVAAYFGGGFEQGGSSFFSTVGTMGISMILGGVAQLLAPNPNAKSTDQRNSYLFQGNATTVYQGTAVGLVYGRALVPPMPVCISTDTIESSTYDGGIVNLGKVGILNNTLLLYSYKAGTATLCGFDEFTDISTPPKKYRTKTFDGSHQELRFAWPGCSVNPPILQSRYTQGGYNKFSATDCSYSFTSWSALNDVISGTNLAGVGICYGTTGKGYCRDTTATNTYWRSIGMWESEGVCCTTDGTIYYSNTETCSVTLSEEDTELDAIARLLPTLTWSAWQSTPVYPYYYRNPSNFNIAYQAVRTKSITLPDKYNPGFTYKYSAILERRVYGSSDPWIEAETVVTDVKPQSDGTLILPEVDIPNVSGYETKVKTISLDYS